MTEKTTGTESASRGVDRRDFIRMGTLAGVGVAVAAGAAVEAAEKQHGLGPAPERFFAAPPIEKVRIGFVGVGGMGSAHVRNLLKIAKIEGWCVITALCDIDEGNLNRNLDAVEKAGFPRPRAYGRNEWDFERMCETEDLDLVYTATPWRWHVPVCLSAMKNGKHAATEVPAAVTLDECWALVETAEREKKHCLMMENCCYGRSEMMVLNMVRHGLFGELIHGECGYCHDLRGVKFGKRGEGLWRRFHSMKRDGNLYPTHGLGPVAQYMDINRGDRFDYLVSMSSLSRGLQIWRDHLPEDDPRRKEEYVLGDVNVSLIRTVKGRTITVVHDTNLPRPYSRINMIQGTKGVFRGYPDRIFIEGRTQGGHMFEDAAAYREEFDHPLWKAQEKKAAGAGHGGMDYLEDYRLMQCLHEGSPTDQNVYDAAAWSVVSELSERSVAGRSRPYDFPDFTRGRWKTWPPLGIIGG